MDETKIKCEICGLPAKEILVNEYPLWYTYVAFCKHHARNREAWKCLTTMDGKRQWVKIKVE